MPARPALLLALTSALLTFLSLPSPTDALYFYLAAGATRCFLEELPQHTIVVGNYKAEEWSEEENRFIVNDRLGIQVTVEEVESKEQIVSTRGLPQGKFTFTSHESGDHNICLRTNYTAGWFSTPQVRLHLDITVGEAKVDEQIERDHVSDLAGKVRDLNARLADIRREQQFQREREAEFRDMSEAANSRAVYWSIFQIAVLIGTCVWQLSHLKAYFNKRKLARYSSSAY